MNATNKANVLPGTRGIFIMLGITCLFGFVQKAMDSEIFDFTKREEFLLIAPKENLSTAIPNLVTDKITGSAEYTIDPKSATEGIQSNDPFVNEENRSAFLLFLFDEEEEEISLESWMSDPDTWLTEGKSSDFNRKVIHLEKLEPISIFDAIKDKIKEPGKYYNIIVPGLFSGETEGEIEIECWMYDPESWDAHNNYLKEKQKKKGKF